MINTTVTCDLCNAVIINFDFDKKLNHYHEADLREYADLLSRYGYRHSHEACFKRAIKIISKSLHEVVKDFRETP